MPCSIGAENQQKMNDSRAAPFVPVTNVKPDELDTESDCMRKQAETHLEGEGVSGHSKRD
jgi:hypothetical protein